MVGSGATCRDYGPSCQFVVFSLYFSLLFFLLFSLLFSTFFLCSLLFLYSSVFSSVFSSSSLFLLYSLSLLSPFPSLLSPFSSLPFSPSLLPSVYLLRYDLCGVHLSIWGIQKYQAYFSLRENLSISFSCGERSRSPQSPKPEADSWQPRSRAPGSGWRDNVARGLGVTRVSCGPGPRPRRSPHLRGPGWFRAETPQACAYLDNDGEAFVAPVTVARQ